MSLRRVPALTSGCIDLGIGSDGRNASVSCTVRMCFANASERVKERSHSKVHSVLALKFVYKKR